MNLNDYVTTQGKGTSYRLARKLGIQPTNFYLWLKGKQTIPPYRCMQLELLTNGAVTCEELNTDYDWRLMWTVFNKRLKSFAETKREGVVP